MKISLLNKAIITIGGSELAGIIGAIATSSSVSTWYQSLQKGLLNPPSWVFGPVWTILYLLMGIAAYLVWKQGINERTRPALRLFVIQLLLNMAWSFIFFGLRLPGMALIEIVIMLIAIILTAIAFYRVSRVAGLLFVPYIAWVSFATYLNASIWYLNR